MSDDRTIFVLPVTGTVSCTLTPAPFSRKIRVSHIHDGVSTPVATIVPPCQMSPACGHGDGDNHDPGDEDRT